MRKFIFSFSFFRLIIVFNVSFPESLPAEAARKILQALPASAKPPKTINGSKDDEVEEEAVKLKEFDGQGQWKGGIGDASNKEEDEEEDGNANYHRGPPGGASPADCVQQ